MEVRIPQLSLVVLIGASGSGKSSFARAHFASTEIVSSDACRGMVSDDENDQSATADAFDLIHAIASKRLANGRLTVIDATNVHREGRGSLVKLAREHDVLPVAVVLDLPEKVCAARNADRPDRQFGAHVVRGHVRSLKRSLRGLKQEGFRRVHVLRDEEAVTAVSVVREPLWNDRRDEGGPFDIIGDVHGCFDELVALLGELGWTLVRDDQGHAIDASHPEDRKLVFLGDLVDRGPKIAEVLRLVMGMVGSGQALCINGNHEAKLHKKLAGRNVKIAHGLAQTIEQLEAQPDAFVEQVRGFLGGLISHYQLDGGRLVVAHAGLLEKYQGRASGRVRAFCLYGETTGETDEFGLPVRHDWAAEYRGRTTVAYGHTPSPEPEWVNRTICLDTGCVFGGKLTALRWPERELVSVPALQVWCEPARPLATAATDARSAQHAADGLLHIEDVQGTFAVQTRLRGRVKVRAEQSAAALEIMSRFAVDPRWLIYLPPTMSPSETSARPGFLEHPAEAFAAFARQGIGSVVCEEKHMGSRAVVVVCRDEAAAVRRFGVSGGTGAVYTRTGRRFFGEPEIERGVLERVAGAMTAAGLWDELESDWVVLDCELMPWSAKAQALLEQQYAPVAAAAAASFPAALRALGAAVERLGPGTDEGDRAAALLQRYRERAGLTEAYAKAWKPYCWEVTSIDDYRLAPFHVLASEGACHSDRDHAWHMGLAHRLADHGGGLLVATPWRSVDLDSAEEVADAIRWWSDLTSRGGEGMVVKPTSFVGKGKRGLFQPAIKCRGGEYLRIIYGPEYTAPEHLDRLRQRGLGRKRSLALREFALGLEGLHRFVEREPLRRVHECVFGVLALESEPVDPRL